MCNAKNTREAEAAAAIDAEVAELAAEEEALANRRAAAYRRRAAATRGDASPSSTAYATRDYALAV
jgi:hypothetical protein